MIRNWRGEVSQESHTLEIAGQPREKRGAGCSHFLKSFLTSYNNIELLETAAGPTGVRFPCFPGLGMLLCGPPFGLVPEES